MSNVSYWTARVRQWRHMVLLDASLAMVFAVLAALGSGGVRFAGAIGAVGFLFVLNMALDGLLFAHKCLTESSCAR